MGSRFLIKSFYDKNRYSLLQIMFFVFLTNLIFFGNIFILRVVYDDNLDINAVNPFHGILTLFVILIIFVISFFWFRLIDKDKKRILSKAFVFDYVFKYIAIGLFVLIAYLTNDNKTIELVFLAIAFLILAVYDLSIYFVYKHKIDTVIIDILDAYRVDGINKDRFVENSQNDAICQNNTENINCNNGDSILQNPINKGNVYNLCILFLLNFLMTVFSSNIAFGYSKTVGAIVFGVFTFIYVAYVLVCVLAGTYKKKYIYILSTLAGVALLVIGFVIATNIGQWLLFVFGSIIFDIPIARLNKKSK